MQKHVKENTFKEKYTNLPQSSCFLKNLQENIVIINVIKIFTKKTNIL